MNANDEYAMGADVVMVTSVLVNWCQPERTLLAVDSLRKQSFPLQIIVVDNGSTDGSAELLKARLPSGVILVVGTSNLGFGGGCNLGIHESIKLNASHVWLVNNDAIPETFCLERMMRVVLADCRVGVVGSIIKDPNGITPDHSGSVMNGMTLGCRYTLSSEELNNEKYAWITGASMLLNVAVLKQVGNFSSKFFMYWEDADLCARVKRCGYKLEVASDAVIYHEAGTSSNSVPLSRYLWHLKSQNLWAQRNHSSRWWAASIIFFRHILKSISSKNWQRLIGTLNYYCTAYFLRR